MVADRSDNPPPEAERLESQSQAYYVDDPNDEIASIERGSDPGGADFELSYFPSSL